jgi:Mitochondrial carrier protein
MHNLQHKVNFLLICSRIRIIDSLAILSYSQQSRHHQISFLLDDRQIFHGTHVTILHSIGASGGGGDVDVLDAPESNVRTVEVAGSVCVGEQGEPPAVAEWSTASLGTDDGEILTSSTSSPEVNSRPETNFTASFGAISTFDTLTTNATMSRRQVFRKGAMVLLGGAWATTVIVEGPELYEMGKSRGVLPVATAAKVLVPANLEPVDFTRVVAETNINISMHDDYGSVSVDSKNFTKIQTKKVPKWYPTFLIPPPVVVKQISNGELLVAATIAGAATSFARDALLYPLSTIKTRIQTDVHRYSAEPLNLQDRFINLGRNVRRHVQEGDVYAGITPTLLISVPATGVYFGVRDVTKRVLGMMPFLNDVEIILIAAFCADVVSLCFRTPADALVVRLQDQQSNVGDWVGDSLKRLPGVIITDLPYLLSKIFLGRQFIHGSLSIDRYAEYAVISAVVAAFLTTPFDVARTRILIDSDGDPSNGIDGGSGEGVIKTMIGITKEGSGGVANLFAGWLERVLYLGIGRAWLEPLQLIAYIGIRDTILLEWF